MRTPISGWVGALLLGALAAPAGADGASASSEGDACARAAVASIQARYEAVRDLQARFVQTTRSAVLGATARSARSRGTVQFAKPGKMRWTYEEPEPSVVASDGETLWLYDPARREVQRMSIGGSYFSGASIQFLLGRGDILEQFEVGVLSCDTEVAELALRPRQPESFERLEVRADASSGDLVQTRVFDLLGNVTEVSFSDIRVDLGLAPGIFTFEPPDGVVVIDLDGS